MPRINSFSKGLVPGSEAVQPVKNVLEELNTSGSLALKNEINAGRLVDIFNHTITGNLDSYNEFNYQLSHKLKHFCTHDKRGHKDVCDTSWQDDILRDPD